MSIVNQYNTANGGGKGTSGGSSNDNTGFLPVKTSIINDIYNFSPAFNNLYTLRLYTIASNDSRSVGNDTYLKDTFLYHATKVDLDGESLSMKRNSITKRFQVQSDAPYKRTETVSITLREDEKWRVRKYHEYWLGLFYDKDLDCFHSCDITKNEQYKLYRLLRIYFPNGTDVVSMVVLPTNMGNLNLGWGQGDVVSHSLVYNVESWWWGEDKPENVPAWERNFSL